MRLWVLLAAGAGVLLAGVALILVSLDRGDDRADPAVLAAGEVVYRANCAACHGDSLQGQPDWQIPLPNGRRPAPPHDGSGHTWHHSDRELRTIIDGGLAALVPGADSDMPGFGSVLSDREIDAVLAYIKSYWSDEQRAYQAERTATSP